MAQVDSGRVDVENALKKSAKVNQPQRRSGREWSIAGLFVLVVTLFYAPILSGIRAFPDGDFVHHFFPFSIYQHQRLAAGELAVWNPYTYGGHPFLADVQAALFYPISNLLYLLTLPITDAATRFYLLQVEAVVHTVLAGYFTYLWVRDLTGSRWGGVTGGLAFALSGYVTGYAPLQLAVLRTVVWLPLLLWSLGRAWQQPRQWRWWFCAVAALSASFLAGHSQSFLFLGYATAAWTICLALVHRPLRVRALIGAWVMGVATIALTAAQWLPSVEFVRYSVRANVDYAFVSGGLALADFWQLFLPGVLTQFSPLYIGVISVVLAVVAIFALRLPSASLPATERPRLMPPRVGILFYLVLAIFALLASLGGNGPLFPLLYRIAPGWSLFRGQERVAFLVALPFCALAGYGMAALPTLTPPMRRRAGFVAGALIVATVYAFGLLWQLPGRTAVEHAGYIVTAGITLLLGLGAALLVVLPGWSVWRGAWIVALLVVNLVWANGNTNQLSGTPADRVRHAPEVDALVQAVGEHSSAANGLPGRVYNEYRVYDDYGMRAGIEDVWGSSPLRVARYAQLFEQFPLDRMWRLLGVQHVLTWRHDLFGPSELLGEFPQATDTTYLHRLPEENPRAWFVSQVAIADDEATWALLADHQFDLDEQALLGQEHDAFAEIEGAPSVDGSVLLARRSPESIDIMARNDRDALLVISETWLPGWRVDNARCNGGSCPDVDGQGRRYFTPMRADLTLIGLWLPQGVNEFTLRYEPVTLRTGLWVSGATLLLLLVLAAWRAGMRVTRR